MADYPEWYVVWDIVVSAPTALEAAKEAQAVQRDRLSQASVFKVGRAHNGHEVPDLVEIDLEES